MLLRGEDPRWYYSSVRVRASRIVGKGGPPATYERDVESGNDYAMARYHVNRLGRFSSTDPLSGNVGDPQSLNHYAYVQNDPINYADPTGMSGEQATGIGETGQTCSLDGIEVDCGSINTGAGGTTGAAFLQCQTGTCGGFLGVGGNSYIFYENAEETGNGATDILSYANEGWDTAVFELGLPGFAGNSFGLGFLSPPPGGGGGGANNFTKPYGLTTPCGSSASGVMGAVESNFARFGNYSRYGGAESVSFAPPAGMGVGSTIPITVGIMGINQSLSVNVAAMNSQSMTFTTNPGHLIYPGYITFAASAASAGAINFNINLGGTIANSAEFNFGGSAFEDAQWNRFLGQVSGFCKVGH